MYILDNPKIDYEMINLKKRAEYGYLGFSDLELDCWYCSGYGGILVFADTDYEVLFDRYINPLQTLSRKDLIQDPQTKLYTIPLSDDERFIKVHKGSKAHKPKYEEPFIRFEVITIDEFNKLCPPINFSNSAMVTKYYVENNCKR